VHRIVDVFTQAEEVHGYSRLVPHDEIEKNEFNLNLPRYIDTQEPEDIQDIGGHLHGGIPTRDIDALCKYWELCPDLRAALFAPNRPGYHNLLVESSQIRSVIHDHPQFARFVGRLEAHFEAWRKLAATSLRQLKVGCKPKEVIHQLSEHILAHFEGQPLLDVYANYQHLMDYWGTTLQDDCYLIAADGWIAKPSRILETDKKGKTKDRGWTCDLVPKPLIVSRYFAKEQAAIDAQQAELESTAAALTELEEEHGGEEGVLGALDKISKAEVSARLKEIKADKDAKDEIAVLKKWLKLSTEETELKRAIREAEATLDDLAYEKYPKLTEEQIKTLVVDDKWLTALAVSVQGELDRVSQTLTGRIKQLAERYDKPLPQILKKVDILATKVDGHLKKMEIKS
jgi:type I restriction enzyme M protein